MVFWLGNFLSPAQTCRSFLLLFSETEALDFLNYSYSFMLSLLLWLDMNVNHCFAEFVA